MFPCFVLPRRQSKRLKFCRFMTFREVKMAEFEHFPVFFPDKQGIVGKRGWGGPTNVTRAHRFADLVPRAQTPPKVGRRSCSRSVENSESHRKNTRLQAPREQRRPDAGHLCRTGMVDCRMPRKRDFCRGSRSRTLFHPPGCTLPLVSSLRRRVSRGFRKSPGLPNGGFSSWFARHVH